MTAGKGNSGLLWSIVYIALEENAMPILTLVGRTKPILSRTTLEITRPTFPKHDGSKYPFFSVGEENWQPLILFWGIKNA